MLKIAAHEYANAPHHRSNTHQFDLLLRVSGSKHARAADIVNFIGYFKNPVKPVPECEIN